MKSTPINQLAGEDDETIQEVLSSLNAGQLEDEVQQPVPVQTMPVQPVPVPVQEHMSSSTDILTIFADRDIKLAVCVAVIATIVIALPIEKTVYNYINLDRIPYSNVLIKALIIAGAYFVISKTI